MNATRESPALFCLDVRLAFQDLSDEKLDRLAATLPKARFEKYARLRAREARERSLGASLLLTRLLPSAADELRIGEFGKPYLPDGPYFSLTHSGALAALAVSERAPIGCDAQRRDEKINPVLVAKATFHPKELARTLAAPPEERANVFYTLWTLKESYVKALGVSFATVARRFAVEPRDDGTAIVVDALDVDAQYRNRGDEARFYYRRDVARDAYLAVCSFASLDSLRVRELTRDDLFD